MNKSELMLAVSCCLGTNTMRCDSCPMYHEANCMVRLDNMVKLAVMGGDAGGWHMVNGPKDYPAEHPVEDMGHIKSMSGYVLGLPVSMVRAGIYLPMLGRVVNGCWRWCTLQGLDDDVPSADGLVCWHALPDAPQLEGE